MRVLTFLVLCVVAVAGGLGWGVWEYQRETKTPIRTIVEGVKEAAATPKEGAPADPPKEDPAKPPVTAAKDPPVKDDPAKFDPVKPPPADPGSKGTDAPGRVALEEGEKLYAGAQFGAAKKKFLQALSAKLSPEDDRKARALQANASLFARLADQINAADILPLEGRGTVYLQNGGVIPGLIEEETDTHVVIRRDNGIQARFSQVQISRIEKQTKEQALADAERAYAAREASVSGKGTGLDWYELAVFCIKNQLNHRVTSLLEKAVATDRNVLESATEARAKILYDVWSLLEKKGKKDLAEQKKSELLAKYPDSRYAKLARKERVVAVADPPKKDPVKADPPREDPPKENPPGEDPPVRPPHDPGSDTPPADQVEPKWTDPKVAALVKKGNEAFDRGVEALERYYDDSTKDEENMKALQAFKEACSAYEEAAERVPDSAWLNARLQQAGENRVACFINAKSRR
jgi:hypothetical protein